jgi:serine/threonine-protein kinase RsbW
MERRIELVVRSTLSDLALVAACVRGVCAEHLVDPSSCAHVELALDEACTNVVRHAHPDDPEHRFSITLCVSPTELEFVIADAAPPYEFGAGRLPPAPAGRRDQLPEGGFGLPLIRATMDLAEYRHERGVNILRLVKRRHGMGTTVPARAPR